MYNCIFLYFYSLRFVEYVWLLYYYHTVDVKCYIEMVLESDFSPLTILITLIHSCNYHVHELAIIAE